MLLSVDATKVPLFFTKVSPEVPLNKLLYNDQCFFCSSCSLFLLPYSSYFHLFLLYQGLISHFPFSPLLTGIVVSSPSCSSFYSSSVLCLYPHLTCLLKPFFLLFPVVSLFEFKSHPSLFFFLLRPIGRRSATGVLAPPPPTTPSYPQAWHTTERSWWPVDLVNNMNLQLSFSFFFLNTHDIDIAILRNCKRKTNYYKIIVNAVSDNPISSLDTWAHCLIGSHPW